MNVTLKRERERELSSWLLLVFNLPSEKASQRVGIWRKLQKFGTFPLRNSGYVLPDTSLNRERFEWLASSIRGFKGEASVLQVRAIDDLPDDVLKEKFREIRKSDYIGLIREIQSLKPSQSGFSSQLTRQKRRLEEIIEIDFFESPLRAKAQEALSLAERPASLPTRLRKGQVNQRDFQGRTWITRPRPGIDRVSSGWLIRRFIDSNAKFAFDGKNDTHPDGVPFDTYQSVYGSERLALAGQSRSPVAWRAILFEIECGSARTSTSRVLRLLKSRLDP